jgi:hypothetical protein
MTFQVDSPEWRNPRPDLGLFVVDDCADLIGRLDSSEASSRLAPSTLGTSVSRAGGRPVRRLVEHAA